MERKEEMQQEYGEQGLNAQGDGSGYSHGQAQEIFDSFFGGQDPFRVLALRSPHHQASLTAALGGQDPFTAALAYGGGGTSRLPPGMAEMMGVSGSLPEASRAAIEAEVSRIKALPETDRAAIGKQYRDPEELFTALEAGGGSATLILRASWLMKQRGGLLPKRGDPLPPEAIITSAELRTIAKASTCQYDALPVIALSHFWRTQEHPDPDGETMELVIDSLEARWNEFQEHNVADLGLLVDYCALWQQPRETSEKEEAFQAGLKAINQWYAHRGTTVWLVTAGTDREKGLSYWEKGWPTFEFALAMLIKPANTSALKDWAQVVDVSQNGAAQVDFPRIPLSEPLAFFGGHTYGGRIYTNGADRDKIVAPKFRETTFQVLGGARELNFNRLGWGDVEVVALAVVLPLCGQLTTLQLNGRFGDPNGQFGDHGMAALAGAVAALENLTELSVGSNRIGDPGCIALAEACANRGMAQLKRLWLADNKIGDAGVSALAAACASEALPNLSYISFNGNPAKNQEAVATVLAAKSQKCSDALSSAQSCNSKPDGACS